MLQFRRPSRTALAALAADQARLPLSYSDVGCTLDPGAAPDGFHRLEVRRDIGTGPDRFAEAKQAIIDWAGHRRAGATLEPELPPLESGGVVALSLRTWPLWVTAACRIVEVIDERERFGFVYGTLPHHPATGEESFLVILDPSNGRVRLEVIALSRPNSLPARLAGPIGRFIQWYTAGRYLDGFESPGRSPSALRPTSWRWWFQNRETGGVTVAQFPNWPLFGIAAASAVTWLSDGDSALHAGTGWLITGLWLFWGGDELIRGVNPWRKLLGVVVIGWQLVRLVS